MISLSKKNQVNKNVIDLIVPTHVEFYQHEFRFRDLWGRVFLITNYPHDEKGGLSQIVNRPGITCSIHIKPMLYGQSQDTFRILGTILVTGKDKTELNSRCKEVLNQLSGMNMAGQAITSYQREALLTVSPFGQCSEIIQDMDETTLSAARLADTFFFNGPGLNDNEGYIFGKDVSENMVLINQWKQEGKRQNANWLILGEPQKTVITAQHILLNEYSQGTQVIIIDPFREFKDMCLKLGGQWINCGKGNEGRINPLAIKNAPKTNSEDNKIPLYNDEGYGLGTLALHLKTLRIFLKLYYGDFEESDKNLLNLLIDFYETQGFTRTTENALLKTRKMPIPSDLANYTNSKLQQEDIFAEQKAEIQKFDELFKRLVTDTEGDLWNGETQINPQSNFIVLDTYDLQTAEEPLRKAQYFNILTWAWHYLSQSKDLRKILSVNHADLLNSSESPEVFQYLNNINQLIRHITGSLITTTQYIAEPFTKTLLKSSSYIYLTNLDERVLSSLNIPNSSILPPFVEKDDEYGLLSVGQTIMDVKLELKVLETLLERE